MEARTAPTRTVADYRHVSSAVRKFIVYTISDAFGLAEEESMWVSFHVQRVLEPVANARPKAIPLPVKQELETGIYSELLVNARFADAKSDDSSTVQASIQDWAQVLADIVVQSYTLRPMMEATIVASFVGILRELGVGNKNNPRASNYLPNAVRHLLNNK